jgi:hypothetical protein
MKVCNDVQLKHFVTRNTRLSNHLTGTAANAQKLTYLQLNSDCHAVRYYLTVDVVGAVKEIANRTHVQVVLAFGSDDKAASSSKNIDEKHTKLKQSC